MIDEHLTLVTPALEFHSELVAMAEEFADAGEMDYRDVLPLMRCDFAAYLRHLDNWARGVNLYPGYVPSDTFWLVRDGRTVLGRSHLRRNLTPELMEVGGHIGYSIRPNERRKGYGTALLALTLEQAKAKGLARVLLTCDSDNRASARIIEKNGGLLENVKYSAARGKNVRRYWIELKLE